METDTERQKFFVRCFSLCYCDSLNIALLECVGRVIPSGANEWEQVAVMYNSTIKDKNRFRDSVALRNKFKAMFQHA